MPLFPSSSFRETPWKNGGGLMRDIVVLPEGAGFEDFELRVSLAWIERDRPFSAFPGVERLFAVVEGQGVELSVDGVTTALDLASAPFAFAGDVATFAKLIDGPVVAFNVMTQRGRKAPSVRRIEGETPFLLEPSAGLCLLVVSAGDARVVAGAASDRLARFDVWRQGADPVRFAPTPDFRAVLVEGA